MVCAPRVIRMPRELSAGEYEFVLLSSIMHEHVDKLFPGMNVIGSYQFRLTRNSDLFVDEEEVVDVQQRLLGAQAQT